VKHLDREDIESLGFEFITQGNVNNFTFQLKSDNFIRLSVAYGEPAQISVYKYGDYDWLQKAFIKNKSELKRILTQIGVL
ncbi:MAG: hypothetical protein KDD03_12195, partial [Gelidibacter sp.]|nr:hypothetical protein [Gelidibacter sp.]